MITKEDSLKFSPSSNFNTGTSVIQPLPCLVLGQRDFRFQKIRCMTHILFYRTLILLYQYNYSYISLHSESAGFQHEAQTLLLHYWFTLSLDVCGRPRGRGQRLHGEYYGMRNMVLLPLPAVQLDSSVSLALGRRLASKVGRDSSCFSFFCLHRLQLLLSRGDAFARAYQCSTMTPVYQHKEHKLGQTLSFESFRCREEKEQLPGDFLTS